MPLIKCYECQRDISDRATACPSCGAPISTSTQTRFAAIVLTAQSESQIRSTVGKILSEHFKSIDSSTLSSPHTTTKITQIYGDEWMIEILAKKLARDGNSKLKMTLAILVLLFVVWLIFDKIGLVVATTIVSTIAIINALDEAPGVDDVEACLQKIKVALSK